MVDFGEVAPYYEQSHPVVTRRDVDDKNDVKTIFRAVITLLSLLAFGNALASEPPDQGELEKAMAYGQVSQLNEIETDFEKKLALRLYEVPKFGGTCFQETHGVCQNKYYLSVSTFDQYPTTNVFSLNLKGKVAEVEWVETERHDYAKLRVVFRQYTEAALANNSGLSSEESVSLLQVTPEAVKERRQ